jgi:hypothetical protein
MLVVAGARVDQAEHDGAYQYLISIGGDVDAASCNIVTSLIRAPAVDITYYQRRSLVASTPQVIPIAPWSTMCEHCGPRRLASANASLYDTLALFNHSVHRLALVNDTKVDHVVGIMSQTDMALAIAAQLRQSPELAAATVEQLPHFGRRHIVPYTVKHDCTSMDVMLAMASAYTLQPLLRTRRAPWSIR